jgi:hypothetical protein
MRAGRQGGVVGRLPTRGASIKTPPRDGNWTNCSDPTQPGIAPILAYLASLPWRPASNCDPGHFYWVPATCRPPRLAYS